MFFFLGDSCDILTKVSDNIFLDKGWDYTKINDKEFWYKGYSLDCVLQDSLNDIVQGYKPRGIWLLITKQGVNIDIYYPSYRGHDILSLNDNLTNLPLEGYHKVSMSDVVLSDLPNQSFDVVSKNVFDILCENVNNFVLYNKIEQPINIACTGGVDSTSTLAVLEKTQTPYNIYLSGWKIHNTQLPSFVVGSKNNNQSTVVDYVRKYHYGYRLTNPSLTKTITACGFWGDDVTSRKSNDIVYLAGVLGVDFQTLIQPNDYISPYIKRDKPNIDSMSGITFEYAKSKILERLLNSPQIWHIDNDMFFCPYHDIRILEQVLTLSPNELINNARNVTIQKRVIEHCDPNILLLLDERKNNPQYELKNFIENFNKVNLQYCKNLKKEMT